MVKAAVVQHCAGTDVAANLNCLEGLTRRAAEAGATFIGWAEAFAYLGSHAGKIDILEPLPSGGPILARCQTLAQALNVELLLGGFHERHETDPSRCYNTSILLNRNGDIHATYRKIHLFDVNIDDGPQLMESRHTAAGEQATIAVSAIGTLGLSVCYDVRFPALYQALVDAGATALTVPSAFTAATGAMHWHTLLKARAIETQCYILAPAQHGQNSPHRASYGHALIVDPWGKVVAEVSSGDGFAIADIDMDIVQEARAQLPSLANRRVFKQTIAANSVTD